MTHYIGVVARLAIRRSPTSTNHAWRRHERGRQRLMPSLRDALCPFEAIPRTLHAIHLRRQDFQMTLNTLMVRYIVDSVDAAVNFYTRHFGFRLANQSGANFALLERENLQLVLSPPKGPGGGSQPTPDGRRPEPGGWNRIIVRTDSLERDVQALESAGVKFRSGVVVGPGGRQTLAEDPSGNLVELFEPASGTN
jgi:catechol 2,3-dioxygenase-like lactoylglutathione lyase family enzyme